MDTEFIAQTLCLSNGWQEPNTLRALQLARDQGALSAPQSDLLVENYRQLLRIECVLRRWSFAGESVLPDDPAALYRVAIRCGFSDAAHFMRAVGEYRTGLRKVYSEVMAEAG